MKPFKRHAKAMTASMLSVVLAFTLIMAGPAGPSSANSLPNRFMSGWMPYWTTEASTNSFLKNSAIFSDISPFWHNAVSGSSTSKITIKDNISSSSVRSSTLAKIKGKGALILPSITDGSGKGHMSAVMGNATRRAALVSQILKLVMDRKYDGIDLDFEKFAFTDGSNTWEKTRPRWVLFMKELSAAFKPKGKKIAVAVPPMYNNRQDGTSGYWVYDYKGISPYIDKLRVMAYDYAWDRPGPIGGPLSWVDRLTKYGVSTMPSRKFQVGTPTYGRSWVVKSTGSCASSALNKITFHSNQRSSLVPSKSNDWKRDSASQERYLNYRQSSNGGKCKVDRSAWVSDQVTATKRLAIAKKYNTGGLAQWMVGTELSSQWAPMKNLAGIRPQRVSRKYKNVLRRPKSRMTIRGSISPKRRTTLTVQRYYKGKWRTYRKVRTNSKGAYKTTVTTTNRKARVYFRVRVAAHGKYTVGYSSKALLRTR